MANVLFKRGNTATIDGTAVTDGQLLYNTTTGQHYIDSDSTRKEVGKTVVNTTAEVSAITADNIPCGTKPVKELITSLSNNYNTTPTNISFPYTATENCLLWVQTYATETGNSYAKVYINGIHRTGIQTSTAAVSHIDTISLNKNDVVTIEIYNGGIVNGKIYTK